MGAAAVGEPVGGHGQEARADGVLAARAGCHGRFDAGQRGTFPYAVHKGVPHTVVQQHPGLGGADRVRQRPFQPVARRAPRRQDEARFDAELAGAEGHGARQAGADLLGALLGGGLA
ncbi:hypothetical protein SRIMM317S_01169 [Streptomyces rimosus subsp. rimosus]